jgi:hypothetical protein
MCMRALDTTQQHQSLVHMEPSTARRPGTSSLRSDGSYRGSPESPGLGSDPAVMEIRSSLKELHALLMVRTYHNMKCSPQLLQVVLIDLKLGLSPPPYPISDPSMMSPETRQQRRSQAPSA